MDRRSFLQKLGLFMGGIALESAVPLNLLNTQRGVDLAFTSADLALSIDDFSDRFIKPAIANVANYIDLETDFDHLPRVGQSIKIARPRPYSLVLGPASPPST